MKRIKEYFKKFFKDERSEEELRKAVLRGEEYKNMRTVQLIDTLMCAIFVIVFIIGAACGRRL